MTTDISTLISRLDDPSTDIAEDAKHALMAQGAVVIPQLAAALPGLDRFGKLSAIEVFEACGNRQAGPGLVGLLSDGDTTVREWAAYALGTLGYAEAGPALARLNVRLLRLGGCSGRLTSMKGGVNVNRNHAEGVRLDPDTRALTKDGADAPRYIDQRRINRANRALMKGSAQ